MALSRTRELDADATALELTGGSEALIAALDKLERHHAGFPALPVAAREDGPMRLLRSHPATSEPCSALPKSNYVADSQVELRKSIRRLRSEDRGDLEPCTEFPQK